MQRILLLRCGDEGLEHHGCTRLKHTTEVLVSSYLNEVNRNPAEFAVGLRIVDNIRDLEVLQRKLAVIGYFVGHLHACARSNPDCVLFSVRIAAIDLLHNVYLWGSGKCLIRRRFHLSAVFSDTGSYGSVRVRAAITAWGGDGCAEYCVLTRLERSGEDSHQFSCRVVLICRRFDGRCWNNIVYNGDIVDYFGASVSNNEGHQHVAISRHASRRFSRSVETIDALLNG